MKTLSIKTLLHLAIAGLISLTLVACNHDSQEYKVSISNLSNAQPLSPPAAILHKSGFHLWQAGEAASDALELMAEGGDASELLKLASNNPHYLADAPLLPGDSIEFNLMSDKRNIRNLSIVGMLVNTNDGFSGVNGIELASLKPGQSIVYYSHTYDAGTEFNSELSGTIPGPADGGEGYNSARDDVTGVITLHGGVVTADDNHVMSTLGAAHKFDNPTLRIVITAL